MLPTLGVLEGMRFELVEPADVEAAVRVVPSRESARHALGSELTKKGASDAGRRPNRRAAPIR